METYRQKELDKLAREYFKIASQHVASNENLNDKLIKAIRSLSFTEEDAEVPGFEDKPMKFGRFENRVFVAMMTDIRDSTSIINSDGGLVDMFLIFYIYAGIVAKIVDDHNGTATEFLGDGVLNLFDTKDSDLNTALRNSALASKEILDARVYVLNPLFDEVGIPNINLGIGIDHGITIVTKFGYLNDTDLKAFGRCVYNCSKLSKGFNKILASVNSKNVWPSGPGGTLSFGSLEINDGEHGYQIFL